MGLSYKCGFVTKPAAPTNTVTSPSLGFTPVFARFRAVGTTAQDTFSTINRWTAGLVTASESGYASMVSNTSAGNTACARRIKAFALGFTTTAGTGVSSECTCSFGANDFTLDFSGTNDANAWLIFYEVWGGTDIANVKILAFTSPTTGAGGTTDLTGFGFDPEWFLLIGAHSAAAPDGATGLRYGEGCACKPGGTTKQWAASIAETSAIATSDTARDIETGACILLCNVNGTTRLSMSLAAFITDGIRFNNDTIDAGNGWRFWVLAGRGGQVDIGTFTKTTGAATASDSFSTAFQAVSVSAVSVMTTAVGNNASARISGGATDGSAEASVLCTDGDALSAGGTTARMRSSDTKWLTKANNNTPTLDAAADITSLGATSVSLSWTTNDAVADLFAFFVLGANAAGAAGHPAIRRLGMSTGLDGSPRFSLFGIGRERERVF